MQPMFQRDTTEFSGSKDNVAELAAHFPDYDATMSAFRLSIFSFSSENLEKHGPLTEEGVSERLVGTAPPFNQKRTRIPPRTDRA